MAGSRVCPAPGNLVLLVDPGLVGERMLVRPQERLLRRAQISKLGVVRRSGVDRQTERHPGYAIGQRVRKRVEEPFGGIKQASGLRKTRHRRKNRVGCSPSMPQPPTSFDHPSSWPLLHDEHPGAKLENALSDACRRRQPTKNRGSHGRFNWNGTEFPHLARRFSSADATPTNVSSLVNFGSGGIPPRLS